MATLASFQGADGRPNPTALVQTSALLECLQYDRRASAQQLLSMLGTAQIVAWVYDITVPTPNVCVISDAECLYVVMTGTDTADQWTGQILGATGEPYRLDPNVRVSAYWDRMWLPMSQFISEYAFL